MKKVITPVGTSIFSNYFDEEKNKNIDSTKRNHYEILKNKPYSEWKNWKKRIDKLKPVISNWAENNENASAEIKSLLKIQEMLKVELEVYLLTSDTILSNVAAEIIKGYFEKDKDINIKEPKLIENLQVNNAEDFSRKGLLNLVTTIETITCCGSDIIFNITGGYKAVIPYMTIMAQINGYDIYYIFEDTDTLIKIPKTPIMVDYNVIEENYDLLKELERGIENYNQWKNKYYARTEKMTGFIETDGKIAFLTPIGKIFLSKYEQKYFTFYAPEDVWKDIMGKKEIKRILATRFSSKEQRKAQTQLKNKHPVFDDGNNQYRIFYFEENRNVYIYKVFTDHSKYDRYLNTNTEVDRKQVKENSQKRKIEKEA